MTRKTYTIKNPRTQQTKDLAMGPASILLQSSPTSVSPIPVGCSSAPNRLDGGTAPPSSPSTIDTFKDLTMRTVDEILDSEFETVTPEEWNFLRTTLKGEAQDASDLEARLAESVQDWAKFNRVIAEVLND